MPRLVIVLCLTMLAAASEAVAVDKGRSAAPAARTCSAYRALCDGKQAADCNARLQACMKTGCWADSAQRAGKAHCGLEKQ